MHDASAWMYFLLLEFLICVSSDANVNSLTVVGNKHLTHQRSRLNSSFSKLFIDTRSNCYVTWGVQPAMIDVHTDSNIQAHVNLRTDFDTLTISMPSGVDFEYVQMDIYLHLPSGALREISLAGITHFQSVNLLSTNNPLVLRLEDTSSLYLEVDAFDLQARFLSAAASQLKGRVKDRAVIKYHGVGDVDASQLLCKRIHIDANGLGTVWITGTEECTIKAEGVSVVKYRCSNIRHAQLTGLAKIIRV